jgi:hypothetical protein
MNKAAERRGQALVTRWRILGWGTIAALILLPGAAMQFTREVQWTAADFVFAILLLGGVGAAFEMAVRATPSHAYRGGAAIALGAGLMLLWANGAVGIVGDEGQRINLWFDLIPLLALFGAIGARFRARGMAAAMMATAAAQIAVGVIVQLYGHFTWVFTLVWTAAWLCSAWLFRQSAGVGVAPFELDQA